MLRSFDIIQPSSLSRSGIFLYRSSIPALTTSLSGIGLSWLQSVPSSSSKLPRVADSVPADGAHLPFVVYLTVVLSSPTQAATTPLPHSIGHNHSELEENIVGIHAIQSSKGFPAFNSDDECVRLMRAPLLLLCNGSPSLPRTGWLLQIRRTESSHIQSLPADIHIRA